MNKARRTRRRTKVQTRSRTLPEGEIRERCYGCYRPINGCFCDSIPRIENRIELLILQHQRERTHAFNTARIVKQSLKRCQLIFDRNDGFASSDLPILPGAGLLYPGPDARLLSDLEPAEKPSQLVILDGTWHHAKTLLRDIAPLRELPRFKLAPTTPGQYRIRREPTDTSLSTLEATVQAFEQLEPETEGWNKLLDAFNAMVEGQLSHPNAKYGDGSPLPKKDNLNVPYMLKGNLANIVIAYGEATPVSYESNEGWQQLNRKKKIAAKLPPVYWVAQRLSSNGEPVESFCHTIQTSKPIVDKFLKHMELQPSDFVNSVSQDQFRQTWNEFLRPGDFLIVHNQGAIRLLQNCDANVPPFELLKSINHDPKREHESLGDFFAAKSFPVPTSAFPGRAGKRLSNALALVQYLNSLS